MFPAVMIEVKGKIYGETELGGAYHGGHGVCVQPEDRQGENPLFLLRTAELHRTAAIPTAGSPLWTDILYGTTPVRRRLIARARCSRSTRTAAQKRCSIPFAAATLPAPMAICRAAVWITAERHAVRRNGPEDGTNCQSSMGCGTLLRARSEDGRGDHIVFVFAVSRIAWTETKPSSGLIAINGMLYGATVKGGAFHDSCTVFALDPGTRMETVVYSFCQVMKSVCKDGAGPGGLIAAQERSTAPRYPEETTSSFAPPAAARHSKSIRQRARRQCFIPFAVRRCARTARFPPGLLT